MIQVTAMGPFEITYVNPGGRSEDEDAIRGLRVERSQGLERSQGRKVRVAANSQLCDIATTFRPCDLVTFSTL